MADGGSSSALARAGRAIAETWGALDAEQRVAGIGAILLIVSTFGPFSFIEGAVVLTGAAVLLLLRRRAQGRDFRLPFGDGTMIAAAGAWAALLILLRLFSRPLGQGLLALVCATILVAAGIRERAVRIRADRPPADTPELGARRNRRDRRRGAPAKDLFGAEAPAWTTPPSGDPSAAMPPVWHHEEEQPASHAPKQPGGGAAEQPSLFDPADREAPTQQLPAEPRRSVPPATRVGRQPPKPDR